MVPIKSALFRKIKLGGEDFSCLRDICTFLEFFICLKLFANNNFYQLVKICSCVLNDETVTCFKILTI